MVKYFFLKGIMIASFCALFNFSALSQFNKSEIINTYQSKDTTSSNKEAYLIFFKNNVFVNYGIYNNMQEREWYVWYATGTYQLADGKIVCQSKQTSADHERLIKDIKHSYKKRSDHILIVTEYEFVKEKYTNYSFELDGSKVTDTKRKLSYFEVN